MNEHGFPVVPGKAPVPSVAQLEETEAPPTVKLIGEFGMKPVPAAETDVPDGPLDGDVEKEAEDPATER